MTTQAPADDATVRRPVRRWDDAARSGRRSVDRLTGLPGPAAFRTELRDAIGRARRNERCLGILALEVGLSGPSTRGSVVAVADRLRGVVRASDTLARLGERHFGVVLEDLDSRSEGLRAAARLAEAFVAPLALASGEMVDLDGRVGLAVSAGELDADALVAHAAAALRAARQGDRNAFDIFAGTAGIGGARAGSMGDRLAAATKEIRAVLADPSQLAIAMQPILDLRTGLVAGYEALARFPASAGRPPDEWFALAHRCGLGPELEALAVANAFANTVRPGDTYLSVNLSPSALVSHAVWSTLPERLDDVVIEVTEHELIEQDPALDAALKGLRARGARIAVDDAGSGYSGLQQLTHLRPDLIKLDRSLIKGIDCDGVKAALVNGLVHFAESIGATVCAEGIERIAELTEVSELGITYGQGYVIARPAPAWPAVADEAVAACRVSFEDALRSTTSVSSQATDRRMATIASAAAAIVTLDDAITVLELISVEMHAEHVCLSAIIDEGRAVQTIMANESFDGGKIFPLAAHPLTAHVLASGDMVQVRTSDPISEASELGWMEQEGYCGLLMAPIGPRSQPIALLEVCCRTERPWTRAEIYRARVICQLLAPAVGVLLTAP